MLPGVFTGSRRALLARLVANGLSQFAAAFCTAWLTQRAFDRMLTPDPTSQELLLLGAGLLTCALVFAWLRVRERIDAEHAGQTYATDLRLRMFDTLKSLPAQTLENKRHGSLIVRFVGDLKALRLWVSLGLSRLTVASICCVGALSALAVMHIGLALTAAGTIALGVTASLILGNSTRDSIRETRRLHARVTANIGEKLNALSTIQLSGQMQREARHLRQQSERLATATIAQTRRLAWLRAIADATGAITGGAVLIVGAWMVEANELTLTTVVAASTLAGLMTGGLRDLGLVYGYWTKAHVAKQKLIELLNWPTLPTNAGRPLRITEGELRLDSVAVAGRLQIISQRARLGERIVVFGPSGSGKSTLLQLVARLIVPSAGTIRIDDQNLRDVDLESLRAQVGMVSVHTPLLRGTIEFNLRYRKPMATEEEVGRAIRLAQLDSLLAELPLGTATKLSEGGVNVAAHLRGRIALARALLGAPCFLLIDDTEVLVGNQQEEHLLERIVNTYQGTIIYAARDPALTRYADQVWPLTQDVSRAPGTGGLRATPDRDNNVIALKSASRNES